MSKTERLPEDECVYLRGLSGVARNQRAASLVANGWSLAALGDAFTPPKTRSTIKSWIKSSSSSSAHSTITAAQSSTSLPLYPQRPVPRPQSNTDPSRPQRRERRVYDPKAPLMPEDAKKRIREIAPTARRYRARVNPEGIFARSNAELTQIAVDLHSRGVSIRELAVTAGVTYRAMARRVGK